MDAAKLKISTLPRLLNLALALLAAGSSAAFAQETAGLLLSSKGAVAVEEPKGVRLAPFAKLPSGYKITLEGGAQLAISHYGKQELARISGPATVLVKTGGLEVLPQSAVVWSPMPKNVAAMDVGNIKRTSGDVRMRSLEPMPVYPEDGESLLDPKPTLLWKGSDNVKVTLVDGNGQSVLEQPVQGKSLSIGTPLAEGMTYSWCIRGAQKGACIPNLKFRVLPAAEAAEITKLKPKADAPGNEWVSYAMAAYNAGAWTEANKASELMLK